MVFEVFCKKCRRNTKQRLINKFNFVTQCLICMTVTYEGGQP